MKMLKNVLKNFVTKSATRQYPLEVRAPFEDFRGRLDIQIENCIFCGKCSRVCPSQCIEVDKKEALWNCDPFACVYCGICEEACPTKCLTHDEQYRSPSREREKISRKGEIKKKPAKKKEAA